VWEWGSEVEIQSLPRTAMRRMEARMAIDQGCVELIAMLEAITASSASLSILCGCIPR
jgi:hypothetical protein